MPSNALDWRTWEKTVRSLAACIRTCAFRLNFTIRSKASGAGGGLLGDLGLLRSNQPELTRSGVELGVHLPLQVGVAGEAFLVGAQQLSRVIQRQAPAAQLVLVDLSNPRDH